MGFGMRRGVRHSFSDGGADCLSASCGCGRRSRRRRSTTRSLSGRVVDPQGAVVPGAHVTARQTDTNIVGESITDEGGRFRFPYLKVGPYELAVHLDGFTDARRTVTLTVGSAFDVSIALTVASFDASVTVAGAGAGPRGGAQSDGRDRHAGRGQQPAAQRPQLSRPRAAGARRVADQRRQHAAVRGNVGRAGPGAVDWQPAQLLEQLHRRRPVGERRCGGIERHSVRRGRGRSVPGGDVGRPGRTRTRARRLHQRRDEERHERRAWRRLRLLPRRRASTPPMR